MPSGSGGPAAPLEHVRRPQPPWRVADVTECGLPGGSYSTLSRDELAAKVARLGKQRTAMTTCMTCLNTAQRWPPFEDDPVAAMERETYHGRCGDTGFRDELVAIATLIERHRDEFADLVAGISATVRLSDRRRSAGSSSAAGRRRR
jgi:hypothetical protein